MSDVWRIVCSGKGGDVPRRGMSDPPDTECPPVRQTRLVPQHPNIPTSGLELLDDRNDSTTLPQCGGVY
eukprot:1732595-Rhodomonas_salina.2